MSFFNPNNSVDYWTFCGDNGAFYTYLAYYHSINAFIWNVQYILTLTVYYQRLLLIFNGSMFGINKHEKMIFKVLSLLALIDLFVIAYFQYENDSGIYTIFWNIFLILYFTISVYLAYMLRKQFVKLITFSQSHRIAQTIKPKRSAKDTEKEKENGEKEKEKENGKTVKVKIPAKMEASARMMIKFTVLTYFSLCFTLCLFLFSVLLWNGLIHFVQDTGILVLIYFTLCYIDTFVSLFCITLQYGGENFGNNEKIYQIFCGKCENIPYFVNIK